MFRGMFREAPEITDFDCGSMRVSKYDHKNGDVDYNLTVDGFTYIPMTQEEIDDLIVFLNTLKEDKVI
jgi:hypothetical protein